MGFYVMFSFMGMFCIFLDAAQFHASVRMSVARLDLPAVF
jgi:hypothetical protein